MKVRVKGLMSAPAAQMKKATPLGKTLIDHVQGLRIEEAKNLLETSSMPVDRISSEDVHG